MCSLDILHTKQENARREQAANSTIVGALQTNPEPNSQAFVFYPSLPRSSSEQLQPGWPDLEPNGSLAELMSAECPVSRTRELLPLSTLACFSDLLFLATLFFPSFLWLLHLLPLLLPAVDSSSQHLVIETCRFPSHSLQQQRHVYLFHL